MVTKGAGHQPLYFISCYRLLSGTHRAEGLKLLVGDEASVQTKEEDGGVGQQASEDDQVVHVGTGHLDQPGTGQAVRRFSRDEIRHKKGRSRSRRKTGEI